MAQLARDAGLGRESLYKALRPGSQPRSDTLIKVMRALGVQTEGQFVLRLRLAQQGEIQEQAVKTVLGRLETDRAAMVAGVGLVDEFETALLASAKALPSPQARLAFASDYLCLRTQKQSA